MKEIKNILINVGADFIDSHVVRLFVNKHLSSNIINLDSLKYAGILKKLLTYVTNRERHNYLYAINPSKLKMELGWEPFLKFEKRIERVVQWYLINNEWVDNITNSGYQKFYDDMYS